MANQTERIVIERNTAPFKIEIGFHTPDDGLDLIDIKYIQFDDRRLEPVGNDIATNVLNVSTDLNSLMADLVPRVKRARKVSQ